MGFRPDPAASILDVPWTETVPTWTGQAMNPAIVDGTLRLRHQHQSRRLAVALDFFAGPGTTFGTGYWLFGTGLQLIDFAGDGSIPHVLTAVAFDASVAKYYVGAALLTNDPGYVVPGPGFPPPLFLHLVFGTNADRASATVPFPWASGDWLQIGSGEAIVN